VTTSQDRREFLRKAGLGAAVAGAWVAPQVLSTSTALAACTPIPKLLQINANSCGDMTTTEDPDLPGCKPSGWATGRDDGVGFTCSGDEMGATITITDNCTVTGAKAVKWCSLASGNQYQCIDGAIGPSNVVTFPTITGSDITQGCVYIEFRIALSCCL